MIPCTLHAALAPSTAEGLPRASHRKQASHLTPDRLPPPAASRAEAPSCGGEHMYNSELKTQPKLRVSTVLEGGGDCYRTAVGIAVGTAFGTLTLSTRCELLPLFLASSVHWLPNPRHVLILCAVGNAACGLLKHR